MVNARREIFREEGCNSVEKINKNGKNKLTKKTEISLREERKKNVAGVSSKLL